MANLNGTRKIQNIAWEARYADLSGPQVDGQIIGFEYHNGANQKWTFQRIGNNGNDYRLTSVFNNNVFIQDTNNHTLQGGDNGTVYTLEFVPGVLQPTAGANGFYSVRFRSPDPVNAGQVVYWTLTGGAGGAAIALAALAPAPGFEQQWRVYAAPA